MREFVVEACRIFSAVLAVYGIYFSLLSLFCLKREKKCGNGAGKTRFAVLVPARNEERCISGIIESIKRQDYPANLVDLYVIPNNCTDRTAEAAAAAGAKILTVSCRVTDKGGALHEAFGKLLPRREYDAYCVFDADNEVNGAFLAEMDRAISGGARAAKSRILAKNPAESWVCACYETYFCNANLFLNRARKNLGLSARLIGTGFAVRRDLMEELGGWNTETLTEDAEFYARLIARGEKIAFVPGAVVYDEEPLTFRESLIQRRRWMSGVMQVACRKGPSLLRRIGKKRGGAAAADGLMQLSFAWVQAWIIPAFLLLLCVEPEGALAALPAAVLRFYAGAFLTGGSALLVEKRLTFQALKSLFLYPLFVFSFLPLQTIALFFPNRRWTPIAHTGIRLRQEAESHK